MSVSKDSELAVLRRHLEELRGAEATVQRQLFEWRKQQEGETEAEPVSLERAVEMSLDAMKRAGTALLLGISAAHTAVDADLAIHLHEYARRRSEECLGVATTLLRTVRGSQAPVSEHLSLQKALDLFDERDMWERVCNAFSFLNEADAPVHCEGTITKGPRAGGPCDQFLGVLMAPYRVQCPKCGTYNERR